MKKIIALLLALVMTFSMAVVAFADDAVTDEPTTGETEVDPGFSNPFENMTEEEIMDYIMGLDMYTVKTIFHVAKIAVKIAFVFDKLGFIDLSPIKNAILDFLWDLIADYITPDADTTEPETTATVLA